MRAGLLLSCPTLCDPVDCGLPGFSVREGGSPGKNTGAYWPILFAIPFWSTIFPAHLTANSPEYLLLPEPLWPSSCTTSSPGPHRGKPKSSRAASGANPSGWPTCRGGNKTTMETRGSVAKEEDPKPSHQLYKLQVKSTQSTRQTLCLWKI